MSDFESALLEVKPAFGVDSGDLEQALVRHSEPNQPSLFRHYSVKS